MTRASCSLRSTHACFSLMNASTSASVTEVSGRGVGLDAVKRAILSMNGDIRVESEAGKGTRFLLRIPLTMALMEGILVRVGGARYVLPAFHVRKFMALPDTMEHRAGRGEAWLDTPEGDLPLVDLAKWLGGSADQAGRPVVVAVEAAGRRGGLVVDEVIGKQQVVVKGLGEGLRDLKGVADFASATRK